ncbi:MAG TPA: DUF169 domain-containing protein [Candidatus Bathyarchaeia archaeon]|nr:DUF169 domain-containing protein [Candidatus Bathyarchaeia archaeon]
MEWTNYSEELRSLLGLEGSPVAVTFSMEPAEGAAGGKCRVCDAFLKARDGATIDLTAATSSCMGGTWFLGLGAPPTGDADKALKDFLVNGEKLFSSLATICRSRILSTPPPTGIADHVVFAPLGLAKLRPDLVLFVCNAEQASRLVTLDMFDTGVPPRIEMSGATCHQAVGYPVGTGELNVSLMDFTSRRSKGYMASDLIVTIPYHRMPGVMRSIDLCTAGRAKFEMTPGMRRRNE